jgi:hypothetical protein
LHHVEVGSRIHSSEKMNPSYKGAIEGEKP